MHQKQTLTITANPNWHNATCALDLVPVLPDDEGTAERFYYALMLFTPPVAGAILDATGSTRGPIWLAIILFALVVPLAIAFQYFKNQPNVAVEKRG